MISMINRPCLDCGALSPGSRCEPCRLAKNNARYARRGTSTERGYGSAYRTRRAQTLQGATHCATCGSEFTEDNPATGGHVQDLRALPRDQRRASAGTADLMPQCATCNYGWRRGVDADTG